MNLIKCLMTQSTCYKGTSKGVPVGILWHDTGGGNPYIKRFVQPDDNASNRQELLNLLGKNQYANDWNHIKHSAGVNAWIGKLADGSIATVQALPWEFRPWGCGSGSKGSCNGTPKKEGAPYPHWIQFEICDDGYKDKTYFQKVYKEAVEFTAYICTKYGIDPNGSVKYKDPDKGVSVTVPTILCHQDSYKLGLGSGHADVYLWFNKFGKTMDDVRRDVAAAIAAQQQPELAPAPSPAPAGRLFTEAEVEAICKRVCQETFKANFEAFRKLLKDNDCGNWSKDAREWAIANGVIAGVGNLANGKPNYAWQDFLTREQMAQIEYRLHHKD